MQDEKEISLMDRAAVGRRFDGCVALRLPQSSRGFFRWNEESAGPGSESMSAPANEAEIAVFDGADHFSVPSLTFLDSSIDLIGWLIGG